MCMGLFGVRLRAISPVIAMIIIVAITLSIAFAVVGWLFGLWGGLAGGTPQISITNVRVDTNGNVELYIVNRGAGSDKALKVELIKGNDVKSQSQVKAIDKNAVGLTTDANKILTIQANARGWVTYEVSGLSLNPGDSVLVKVYLEKSGVYSLPVVVSPASAS